MSLDNFRNRTIIWDTVNKDFPQPIQAMQGDVNARTLLIKIVDNGVETDLTGHSLKLTYQYTNSSNSGFVMIPPKDLAKGEFILVIPTEMTKTGVIEANLVLLNEDKEQVIVSKNLTFISDNSTVTDLAQEVNNKIDDFTKLLLENMPQVMRSELNDLHAQTESNKSNIELKANLADMTSLQSAMTELKNEVEAFGISPENLVTIKSLLDAIASNASESEVVELINSVKVLTSNISLMSNGDYSPKANQTDLESLQHTVNDHSATISAKANQTDLDNLQATIDKQGVAISTKAEQSELSITNKIVTTAQETANKAESEAKNAMAKATEAQTNSLPINGNAVSASKLATARKLGVNLQSSSFQDFDGTADATDIGVSGVLPIEHGGTSTSDGVINTIAYAKSADGTDGFTTVYPNLNLLTNTKITQGYIDSKIWVPIGASSLSVSSNNGIKVINNGGDIGSPGGFSYAKPTNVSVGDTITLSCYIKNTGTVDIKNFSISIAFYGKSRSYPSKDNLVIPNDGKPYFLSLTTIVPSGAEVAHPRWFDFATAVNEKHIFEVEEIKLELGSIATPWMPSASEVTIDDYPKYVGFSNSIKPNKKSSDYNWLPLNGNAVSASKLETARKLGVNLQSSAQQNFDGTADATNIGVTGVLPIANGGTSTSDGVINTTAYANSADGTDGFTTVYPKLNLFLDSKNQLKSGAWYTANTAWTPEWGTYLGSRIYRTPHEWDNVRYSYKDLLDRGVINTTDDFTYSIYFRVVGEDPAGMSYSSIKFISEATTKIGDTVAQLTSLKEGQWTRIVVTFKFNGTKYDPAYPWATTLRVEAAAPTRVKGAYYEFAAPKLERGSIATPYMPAAGEVTINDYPKYVGFSNSIKPNKKSSDYNWLPMGLVSIDSDTGLLKPAVIGIDCAQAHLVGSVVTNTSSSSSGYSTGKWENIGSAVIGSTTIYYWKRTA